jgi:hypothetical protein
VRFDEISGPPATKGFRERRRDLTVMVIKERMTLSLALSLSL